VYSWVGLVAPADSAPSPKAAPERTCQDRRSEPQAAEKRTLPGVSNVAKNGLYCRSGMSGVVARLLAICSQFEGYKPGQNRCRIELANDAFDIAKTSRQRVHGNDIAVTGRCQGDEAQIEK